MKRCKHSPNKSSRVTYTEKRPYTGAAIGRLVTSLAREFTKPQLNAVFTTEGATNQDVQRPKSVFNAPSIGVHCAELSRGTSCPRSITPPHDTVGYFRLRWSVSRTSARTASRHLEFRDESSRMRAAENSDPGSKSEGKARIERFVKSDLDIHVASTCLRS